MEALELAASSQIVAATAALCVLCYVPIESVDHAINHDRSDAVLVIARTAELSVPTVTAILRIRAEPLCISPSELQHCLRTFWRLTPAVARQIVRFCEQRVHSMEFTRSSAEMVFSQNLH